MAEEADSSQDCLGAESGSKEDTINKEDKASVLLQNGSNKRDHSDHRSDSSPFTENSESSKDEEGNKRAKSDRKKQEDAVASGSNGSNSRQSSQRNYRPRLIESSSSGDETNTLCELGPGKPPSHKSLVSTDKDKDSKANAPPDSTSEMGDTSADTSRDTETDHMEPTSPSAMETGSAASGNTDNDNTGSATMQVYYQLGALRS